jgi:MFS family permease
MSDAGRNVPILAVGYAIAASGASLVVFAGGIVGGTLAPVPGLATLPVALSVVGVAVASAAAALLMGRIGRRAGFLGGALLGAAASMLAAAGITTGSFNLFCTATFLLGANIAFVLQYRFAAAESVTPDRTGRAVSLVLVGGIVAGYLGPEIARRTVDASGRGYHTAFLVQAGLYLVVAALMLLLRPVEGSGSVPASAVPVPVADAGDGSEARTRGATDPASPLRFPSDFVLAAAAGMVAYGSMSLLMTATPMSMHTIDGHPVDAAAIVIQSHAIAMYLPSLFTGALIARIGDRRVMLLGVLAIFGSTIAGASSHAVHAYWVGLVALGLGWNFLFIGGTVLLARAASSANRFRIQAANDTLVFGTQAVAALASGAALHALGWRTLNLMVLPGLALMTLLIVWPRTARRDPRRSLATAAE